MKSKLLFSLLIIAIISLIYGNSLSNGFVWLDQAEILNKKLIISDFTDFMKTLFSQDNNFEGYHRPMYNLMHSFDYYLWGENAFGFHLSSLILHLFNVVLLFKILSRLSKDRFFAIIAAFIFGLLPCHTATVSLIHSKADLLTTLFILVTINLASKIDIQDQKNRSWLTVIGLSLAFVLALLTKEVAIMLPIFGIGFMYLNRSNLVKESKRYVLYPLLLIALLFLAFRFSNRSVVPNADSLDFLDRILTFIPVYVNYIGLTLSGMELTTNDAVMLWDRMPTGTFIGYVLAFFALIIGQFYLAKKHILIAAGFLWYNLFLIPVAQIIPILHFRADRFIYLPSIGFVIAVVYFLFLTYQERNWRQYKMPLMAVLGVYLLFSSYKIWDRNKDFISDRVMFSQLIAEHPECREAQGLVGNNYIIKGEYDKAMPHISASLEQQEAYYSFSDKKANQGNLGVVYMHQNKNREALEIFNKLLNDQRVNPEVYFNLGVCNKRLNNFKVAQSHFEKYLEYNQDNLDALFNLGHIGLELGDRNLLKKNFGRYLEVNPNSEHRQLIEQLLRS